MLPRCSNCNKLIREHGNHDDPASSKEDFIQVGNRKEEDGAGVSRHKQEMAARTVWKIASGKEEIQGSVCDGCHSAVTRDMTCEVQKLVAERPIIEHHISRFTALAKMEAELPVVDDTEISTLETTIELLKADLLSSESESSQLESKLLLLNKEHAAAEAALDHQVRSLHAATVADVISKSETDAVKSCDEYNLSQINHLGSATGYASIFRIEADSVPASINGYRICMPDCYTHTQLDGQVKVPWQEINTALGFVVQVLLVLRSDFPSYKSNITLKSRGSVSKIEHKISDSPSAQSRDLFGANSCSTTSFDEGLEQLSKGISSLTKSINVTPPKSLKIRDVSLRDGHNYNWSHHMLSLLANLKHLILVINASKERKKRRQQQQQQQQHQQQQHQKK